MWTLLASWKRSKDILMQLEARGCYQRGCGDHLSRFFAWFYTVDLRLLYGVVCDNDCCMLDIDI